MLMKYIAKGTAEQIDYLRHELVAMLDIIPSVSRASDSNRTLVDCMDAEPPLPEEIPLDPHIGLPLLQDMLDEEPHNAEDILHAIQSSSVSFMRALREYHMRPSGRKTTNDVSTERAYEWYINPMMGFSGMVGSFEVDGRQQKRAYEVASVIREGDIKLLYQEGAPELTLTIQYGQRPDALKQIPSAIGGVLGSIKKTIETAEGKGVRITVSTQ
jgi:hypothetical protein